MIIKLFLACKIQYSFNSYIYHLAWAFIASIRAFHLLTRAFSLPTRGFELVTRRIELVTRAFQLATCSLGLIIRNLSFTFPLKFSVVVV